MMYRNLGFDFGDMAYEQAQLGGFFKKIFKPVRKLKKKVESTLIPKRLRKRIDKLKESKLFKIVSAVALSVVGGMVLGPAVGAIVSKLGAVAGVGANAATAARIGSTINKASKVYKTAKNVRGAVNLVKNVKKAKQIKRRLKAGIAQANAANAEAAAVASVPVYSPVPSNINSPAMFELAYSEALRILSTDKEYIALDAEEKKEANEIVALEIRRLQAETAAKIPANYNPQPSPALNLEPVAIEALQDDALNTANGENTAVVETGETAVPPSSVVAAAGPAKVAVPLILLATALLS